MSTLSTVTHPDGSVTEVIEQRSLAYTNTFGEEMRISRFTESDVVWRSQHPEYSNVRVETRLLTTTVTPWSSPDED